MIDLRSLSPLDTDTIFESVRRTGRCVVVHEAPVTGGLGAEIAVALGATRKRLLLNRAFVITGGWPRG